MTAVMGSESTSITCRQERPSRSAASIASASGAQSPAPGTSVASAPAAHARCNARSRSAGEPGSLGQLAASTPANTSPAPVVSSAATAGAGTSNSPSAPTYRAPRAPRVTNKWVGRQGHPPASASFAITTSATVASSARELWSWPAGEALTMTTAPAEWASSCRRHRRAHRNLQLGQQHIAFGNDRAHSGVASVRLAVGARRDHDGVLGAGIDHDDRRAAGPRHFDGPVQPDAVGQEVSAQLFGGCVVADRADELHLRTRARRCHGLIAALAAGCVRQRRRQHRLARTRKGIDAERQIHVHAADHADSSHYADVSRGEFHRARGRQHS